VPAVLSLQFFGSPTMENESVNEDRDQWTEMDVRGLMSELRRAFQSRRPLST
jgi:hypothetical protein